MFFRKKGKSKVTEHTASEMVALDLTRMALQRLWSHPHDWVPDWYDFRMEAGEVQETSDNTLYDRRRTVVITGSILEARAKMGPSDIEVTCSLERHRNWVRGFGWQLSQIDVVVNPGSRNEDRHTFRIDYVSVEELTGYVHSYRTPIFLPDPPDAPRLPWRSTPFLGDTLSRRVIPDR